jgi:hypothetical protein
MSEHLVLMDIIFVVLLAAVVPTAGRGFRVAMLLAGGHALDRTSDDGLAGLIVDPLRCVPFGPDIGEPEADAES